MPRSWVSRTRSSALACATSSSSSASLRYATSTPSSRNRRASVPRWASSTNRGAGIHCGRGRAGTSTTSPLRSRVSNAAGEPLTSGVPISVRGTPSASTAWPRVEIGTSQTPDRWRSGRKNRSAEGKRTVALTRPFFHDRLPRCALGKLSRRRSSEAADQLGPGVDRQALENVAQVVVDRSRAHEHPLGHLPVGGTLSDQPGDLHLLRGEPTASETGIRSRRLGRRKLLALTDGPQLGPHPPGPQ